MRCKRQRWKGGREAGAGGRRDTRVVGKRIFCFMVIMRMVIECLRRFADAIPFETDYPAWDEKWNAAKFAAYNFNTGAYELEGDHQPLPPKCVYVCACVCVRVFMCMCACACVRACARACERASLPKGPLWEACCHKLRCIYCLILHSNKTR